MEVCCKIQTLSALILLVPIHAAVQSGSWDSCTDKAQTNKRSFSVAVAICQIQANKSSLCVGKQGMNGGAVLRTTNIFQYNYARKKKNNCGFALAWKHTNTRAAVPVVSTAQPPPARACCPSSPQPRNATGSTDSWTLRCIHHYKWYSAMTFEKLPSTQITFEKQIVLL